MAPLRAEVPDRAELAMVDEIEAALRTALSPAPPASAPPTCHLITDHWAAPPTYPLIHRQSHPLPRHPHPLLPPPALSGYLHEASTCFRVDLSVRHLGLSWYRERDEAASGYLLLGRYSSGACSGQSLPWNRDASGFASSCACRRSHLLLLVLRRRAAVALESRLGRGVRRRLSAGCLRLASARSNGVAGRSPSKIDPRTDQSAARRPRRDRKVAACLPRVSNAPPSSNWTTGHGTCSRLTTKLVA